MRQFVWTSIVLVSFGVICNNVESRSLVTRQVHDVAISPNSHEADHNDAYRDKRKVEALYGVKNAVLGFVFNKRSGFAWDSTARNGPTTTEDTVIFEKDKPVSLQIPDELFGSSFSLVTNLSNTVGDFMINSALRAQRLLEAMRPFLRGVFGAKGIVIEATTDKPIFSAPASS